MNYEYDKEFYYKFREFIVNFMDFLYDIDSNGLDNIPTDEKYILAGNHLHILDAALIAKYVDSELHFMVDNKLYRYKLWEKFFKRLGTFGIDPERNDIKAVKEAVEIARKNNIVIFPEGKTHRLDDDVAFKTGIARLSIFANSVIVPFGINGTYKPFSKLQINFGQPIDFRDMNLSKKEMDLYLEDNVRKLQRR